MSKKLIEQLHPVGFATQAKRIEELERANQHLIMALADAEALEIGTAERCIRWRESHKLSQEQVTNLKKALKELYFGYVRLMENGRDRIMMLGGDCDSLQHMEENDPLLIEMREILK